MKLKSKPLQSAVDGLRTMVKGRNLPILSCLLIQANDSKLSITATDLDQWETSVIECDGDLEPTCVSALHLACCIGSGETVGLKRDGQFLEIKAGGSVSRLPIQDAGEFPPLPESKAHKKQGISCSDLAEGIFQVAFCASNDLTREALCSVHVLAKAKMLLVEANNGANGAFFERPMICPALEIVIPSDFSSRVAHALGQKGAELKLSDKSIIVTHDAGSYFCKQVDCKYPDTGGVRGYKQIELGSLNVAKTVEALDSCTALIDESKTPSGLLAFTKDGLSLNFSTVHGAQVSDIPGKFKDHEAKVNITAMNKCLKAMKVDECKLFRGDQDQASDFLSFRSGDLLVMSMCLRKS